MATIALFASAYAIPESGSDGGNIGGIETYVVPGSPVWRNGIRAGDRITDLHASTDPGGWEIFVTDAKGETRSSAASDHIGVLRSYIPWSLLGIAIAAAAALLAYRGNRAAAPLLPIALFLAAQPMLRSGSLASEVLGGTVFFVGSAIAAVAFTRPRWLLIVPLTAGAGLAAAWVLATVSVPAAFDPVDVSRVPAAAGLSLVGFLGVADRRRIVAFLTDSTGPTFVDVLYLGFALALFAAGLLNFIPVLPAALLTGLAVVTYPFSRRATVAIFETLVTSQARRDASIRAVEDERSRLARDIHDSPLQELSGIIRRLESVPGAEGETDALRAVAGHLRDVATSLHPPVLQDLGLAAAIEDLRDQLLVSAPDWLISVAVDDLTGDGRPRPPADVELAAFRVTQEAAANAITHSGGRSLEIRGSVAAEAIELQINDDGRGLRVEDARSAKRAGHFGLDSMRERSEAIGASMAVTAMPDGVGVRFQWEGRS
jgi:signal transduction histidine kinase